MRITLGILDNFPTWHIPPHHWGGFLCSNSFYIQALQIANYMDGPGWVHGVVEAQPSAMIFGE